ncbi:MAG: hypothetical protein RMJ44_12500, partial [Cytophagales bacterium]|nr:hypothetical protein [Cytophagales bacterium]
MKETNINIEIITFPRQFGVEIEYFSETEVPCASYYAHKRRKVLYKYDSSLNGDDGFAVEVAIPFSYS